MQELRKDVREEVVPPLEVLPAADPAHERAGGKGVAHPYEGIGHKMVTVDHALYLTPPRRKGREDVRMGQALQDVQRDHLHVLPD